MAGRLVALRVPILWGTHPSGRVTQRRLLVIINPPLISRPPALRLDGIKFSKSFVQRRASTSLLPGRLMMPLRGFLLLLIPGHRLTRFPSKIARWSSNRKVCGARRLFHHLYLRLGRLWLPSRHHVWRHQLRPNHLSSNTIYCRLTESSNSSRLRCSNHWLHTFCPSTGLLL